TTEEIWEHIPQTTAKYAQLTDMPDRQEVQGLDDNICKKWDHFLQVRGDVLKALEEARNEKVIGKPLEARITIQAKDEYTKEVLNNMDNLHQWLIVSDVIFNETPPDGSAEKRADRHRAKAGGEHRGRCWVCPAAVGDHRTHPTRCTRCAKVVQEPYSHVVDYLIRGPYSLEREGSFHVVHLL